MEKVNLRDLYPDVYKTDHFVEVAEDVLENGKIREIYDERGRVLCRN